MILSVKPAGLNFSATRSVSFGTGVIPHSVLAKNNMISQGPQSDTDSFQSKGSFSPDSSFIEAAPASFQPVDLNKTEAIKRFAVIGDFGVGHQARYFDSLTSGSGEDAVLKVMMKTFKDKPYASVLTMGDNVYPSGQSTLFNEDIKRPLSGLQKEGVRFYPVLGNHDVVDPTEGGKQLDYWGTPRYYQSHIGNVDIFGIDTTLFFPGYGKHKQDKAYVDNPEQAKEAGKRQLEWLDKALASSTAKYKIVYGHFPIYSQNEKLEPPGMLKELRDDLEPILKRNHVDAYLAGHHHAYERNDYTKADIPEFISGAGGRVLSPKEIKKVGMDPISPITTFIPQRHFMMFEETPNGLSFQAIDKDGQIIDQGLLPPKNPQVLVSDSSSKYPQEASKEVKNRFKGSLNPKTA